MTNEQNLQDFVVAVATDIKNLNEKTDTFVFSQMIPSDVWTIVHNKNTHPSVSVVDSAGTVVNVQITYQDNNTVIINSSYSFSGQAFLN